MNIIKNKIKTIGYLSIIIGIICIIVKALLGDYIDSDGFLHEYFFLLVIGFSFIFIGIVILCLNFFTKNK